MTPQTFLPMLENETERTQAPCPQLSQPVSSKQCHFTWTFTARYQLAWASPQIRKEMWLHEVRITAGGSIFHSIDCEWHTPTSLLRCVRTSTAVIYTPHNVVTVYRSMNKQYLSCWILSNTNALKKKNHIWLILEARTSKDDKRVSVSELLLNGEETARGIWGLLSSN